MVMDIRERIGALTPEQIDMAILEVRGVLARDFSAEGFTNFYNCIYGVEPPPYVSHVFIPRLINAYKNRKGVMMESFRGSTKSTTLVAWGLFVMGHNPSGSTVIVRINDQAAAETGALMANIIEFNNGWKACFPNVIPDKGRGWSTNGYHIIDKNVVGENNENYGKWVETTSKDHLSDPSILAAGIGSSVIIGKHPSNGMYFDDLHDEKNTSSDREMAKVVQILVSDIIPTWTRPGQMPTLGVACTLWHEKDAYHAMLATGLFERISIPIYFRDDFRKIQVGDTFIDCEWTKDYPVEKFNGVDVVSSWNEAYPVSKIQAIHNQNAVQFPRMYECNLAKMKGISLRKEWLHEYPFDKLNPSWPVYFGVDFASTSEDGGTGERDNFALAIGRALPSGGIIVIGGFVGKISTAQGIETIKTMGALYHPTLIAVEKYGKGEEFFKLLLYNTKLNVMAAPVRGTVPRRKGQRFEYQMAPLFSSSRAWISDVKDDFLRVFEEEWVGWDGLKSSTGHDDTLDAVYWCLYAAQGHLMAETTEEELPPSFRVRKKTNPYKSLANWRSNG